MNSLDRFAASKLDALAQSSLRRELQISDRFGGAGIARAGQRLISFSCNDYLNLATHPEVVEAAVAATRRYGAGAGASRAVTGNHPLYAALEARLAAHKGSEAAVVFGSGYLANSGIIPALIGEDDAIFVDELAHACIWAGARLSGAAVIRFRHNDMADLAAKLAASRARHKRAMIATDTVFSMDGDLAPIGAINALAARHDAWVLTDDAHGLGVLPAPPGARDVPLQMGTMSKALGAYGGYVCTSAAVAALLRNRARSFVYTTGLPPGTVAAATKALELIARDPDHAARPLARARQFTRALGLNEATSPVVPLILGSAEAALAAAAFLLDHGFLVTPIRPPTVPDGTARLRFAFSAAHAEAEVTRMAALVKSGILPSESMPSSDHARPL